MGILWKDKDYAVKDGHIACVSGGEDVLSRVLFLLTARRGSFPFLPEMGSRLYCLSRTKPGQWQSLAEMYVAEALAGEQDVAVTQVRVRREGERLWVETDLEWQGQRLSVQTDV